MRGVRMHCEQSSVGKVSESWLMWPPIDGVLLDQHDLVAAVGDVERRLDAGDAAADDQGALGHRDADRLQRLVVLDLLDDGAGDVDRLGGRLAAVVVDPGAVLADVGHLARGTG